MSDKERIEYLEKTLRRAAITLRVYYNLAEQEGLDHNCQSCQEALKASKHWKKIIPEEFWPVDPTWPQGV